MTDPVTCGIFATFISCPNRFSDREMQALGFTTFPPPAPDPCITQGLSLRAQLSGLNAQLAQQKAQIDAATTTLADLKSQIRAIEAQYPGGAPADVYANYQALLAQYNALSTDTSQRIATYNSTVAREREIVGQLNALPCDSS
jgi:hypothetical protein